MRQLPTLSSATLLLSVVVGATTLAAQDEEGTYGYVRVLEGRATVTESQTGEESEAEEQLPLLSGDVFRVHASSRLEAVLADRSRIRLDENTTIELLSLAGSADSQATQTAVRLRAGRLHYVVVDPPPAESAPVVETESAQFFLQESAQVLIAIEGSDSTRLIVRRGYVEVVTSRGSSLVRAQEEALVSGGTWTNVAVGPAGRPDSFEDWADDSEYRISQARSPLVEEELQYEAASLGDNGAWLTVDGDQAWRPHVTESWQPYWNGRWAYTPTGLSWVSFESWGWLPYHYGSWDFHHHHGWLWYPGSVFATAHVQWYWGHANVGWVPKRYYNHHRHSLFGLHIGQHGGRHQYAHASWQAYDHWVFVPSSSLGHRRQHQSHRRSSYFRDRGDGQVPRGLIASDTSGLGRAEWRDPDKVRRVLERPVRRASLPAIDDSPRTVRLDESVRRPRPAPRASGAGDAPASTTASRAVRTRPTRGIDTSSRQSTRRAEAAEVLRRSRREPSSPIVLRSSDAGRSDDERPRATSRSPVRRAPVTRPESTSGVRSLAVERRGVRTTPRSSSAEPVQRLIDGVRSGRVRSVSRPTPGRKDAPRRSPTTTQRAPMSIRSLTTTRPAGPPASARPPVSRRPTVGTSSRPTARTSPATRPSSPPATRAPSRPTGSSGPSSSARPSSSGSSRSSQARPASRSSSGTSSSRSSGRSSSSRRRD